jgi:HPt (histidine-containing phosphotransfer) domain-containing protein
MTEPLLDRQAMLDNLGEDDELVRLLAGAFVDDAPHLLDTLRSSLAADDAPGAARASHNLKGSATNFGAAELVRLAFAIESSCRMDDLATARARLPELEALTAALVAELHHVARKPI